MQSSRRRRSRPSSARAPCDALDHHAAVSSRRVGRRALRGEAVGRVGVEAPISSSTAGSEDIPPRSAPTCLRGESESVAGEVSASVGSRACSSASPRTWRPSKEQAINRAHASVRSSRREALSCVWTSSGYAHRSGRRRGSTRCQTQSSRTRSRLAAPHRAKSPSLGLAAAGGVCQAPEAACWCKNVSDNFRLEFLARSFKNPKPSGRLHVSTP